MKIAKAVAGMFLKLVVLLVILETGFVIHEYGHLRELQKRDIPVKEFSLGIGPAIYQYQTDSSFEVSFRLIPIMAYVLKTEEGGVLLEKEGSLGDKLSISIAGVRNNLLVSLVAILALQILGWSRYKLSTRELFKTMMMTPVKMVSMFVALLIGCATFGRVSLTEKTLLSTGGIKPSKPLGLFILMNLSLGFLTLAPISPLDGGHMAGDLLCLTGFGSSLLKFLEPAQSIVFFLFIWAVNSQGNRIMEFQNPPGIILADED